MQNNMVSGGFGRNRVPPAAGGGGIVLDSSISYGLEDVSSITSVDAWTIAGTDRWAYAAMLNRDFGTLGTHTEMRISGSGGSLMTLLDAAAVVDLSARVSARHLIAPGTGSTRTLYGLLSEVDSSVIIAGAVWTGVHQTTPVNGSPPTPTNGTFSSATSIPPSITVTTATNGLAVAALFIHRGTTDTPSITPGTGVTVVKTIHQIQESIYILSRPNNGGSTVVAATVTFAAADGEWYMVARGAQPA